MSGAGGKPTAGGKAPVTAEEHFGHPNVLVAHLKEGIEAIHLYTGAQSCAVFGRPAILHVMSRVALRSGCVRSGGLPLLPIVFWTLLIMSKCWWACLGICRQAGTFRGCLSVCPCGQRSPACNGRPLQPPSLCTH